MKGGYGFYYEIWDTSYLKTFTRWLHNVLSTHVRYSTYLYNYNLSNNIVYSSKLFQLFIKIVNKVTSF